MKYTVVSDFRDLHDCGYQYHAGDIYPHDGEADEARAKHLMTPTEQRGALIAEKVEKPAEKEPEAVVEVVKPKSGRRKKSE